MVILLTIVLFSWLAVSALYLPFIKLLYRWKMQRQHQSTRDAFNKRTPIFDKFHMTKAGTPVGGGLLIILFVSLLLPILLIGFRYFFVTVTAVYPIASELKILLFSFIGFGILGLVDDIKKTFALPKDRFFGLRLRHKLFLEILLGVMTSFWIMTELKITFFHIPFFGVFDVGWLFIPIATFIIISFANAFNITDGLDGLASGILVIALMAFWFISSSILDTTLSVFLALWIGALLAFLYFNINPARIFLGDTGALSFGATFAVVGILLGKTPLLVVIGGLFVLEVFTSLVQLLSKRFTGKKVFPAAPLHLWLQERGWPETKIVMRFWILTVVLALCGLWLAIFTEGKPL